MPELPDLLHVLGKLRERLVGRTVTAERLREPVVLRCLVHGNLSLLLGRALRDIAPPRALPDLPLRRASTWR